MRYLMENTMKLKNYTYLLALLMLFIFTTDLNGQFRRKKVKLSQTNKIEEFINDYIQDPFMIEHIQSLQSELVKIGFEILPPETDGDMEVLINFEDFNFDPYYGSTADPKTSSIIFRDPKANQVLADDEYSGPMTNAFGSTTSNNMGYGSSNDQPIDVNAIILDWMQQIKNFY